MTEADRPVQASLPGSPQVATGDERIDAALASLTSLDSAEPAEHADVIEGVHDRLRDVLSELTDGPVSPTGPPPGASTDG